MSYALSCASLNATRISFRCSPALWLLQFNGDAENAPNDPAHGEEGALELATAFRAGKFRVPRSQPTCTLPTKYTLRTCPPQNSVRWTTAQS